MSSLTDLAAELAQRTVVRMATYNIQSGRAGRLEMALRAMEQMNVDLGILTEAKLTNGIHTRYSSGYQVFATEARSHCQGGVALFYRHSPFWQVESVRRYGPNVISFQLVMGSRCFGAVGAYIPPTDLSTLEFVKQALDGLPRGIPPLLLGDLNADLADPRDERARAVATEMAMLGLDDMLQHFRQRRAFRHRTTWWQQRASETYRSRCDYILGTDRRQFTSVSIRDPSLFSSDHFLVLGTISSDTLRENKAYLHGRRRFPLRPPKWGPRTETDAVFQTLVDAIPPRTLTEKRARRGWISESTWTLVDKRAAMRRAGHRDQATLRRLGRRIQRAFKVDRLQRTVDAGTAIESFLAQGKVQEAWTRLKAWYRHAGNRPHKPSRQDLQAITAERIALYTAEDPPGPPIPVLVPPAPVADETPSPEEIGDAVR